MGWGPHRPFYRLANHEVHATSRGGATNTYVDHRGSVVHSTGRRYRELGEPVSMASHYVADGLGTLIWHTGTEPETMTSLAMATVTRLVHGVDEAAAAGNKLAEGGAPTIRRI